jgi:outer membrane protein OmpA-like peptidoglycan-associated protein
LYHSIDNLFINKSNANYVGLFGILDGGTIRNLGLSNVNITGYDYVGGLVGSATNPLINNVYVTGTVTGHGDVGGLVGLLTTTNASKGISDAYSAATVSAQSEVGGLVGLYQGNNGYITRTYATGAVTGHLEVGGLVGGNLGTASINQSFYATTDASGAVINSGGAFNTLGTGKALAELKQLSTFTNAGWDISDVGGDGSIWRIYEGQTSPLLRGFMTSVTVNANFITAGKTYDGQIASGTAGSYTTSTPVDASLIGGTLGYASNSANAGSYSTADGTLRLGGLYSGQLGYDISYGGNASLTIDKASATVTANSDTTTYNGQTQTTSGYSVSGLVNGEDASVLDSIVEAGGSGRNAGSYTHTVSGSDNNYHLAFVDGTLTINKATLDVSSADVTKTYDGNTTANGSAVVVGGQLFGSDSISGGSFAFTDKNAGSNKTVTVSGVTVNDGNSGNNYDISYATNTASTIDQKALTVSGFAADNKIYDGNTNANSSATSWGSVATGVTGESLNLTHGAANFADANVANGIAVTATGYALADGTGLASNYTLTSSSAATTANITPAMLTYTANPANRSYGRFNPAFSGTLTGFVNGEDQNSATTGTLAFTSTATASNNVGSYTINGSGLNASNYVFAQAVGNSTALTINPANLVISTANVTKTYDGLLTANGSAVVVGGQLFGSDSISGGSFTYTDKNAGSGKTVITNEVSVNDGNNGNNYALTYVANTNSRIDKADLVITARDDHKVMSEQAYQGGNGIDYQGLAQGDDLSSLEESLSYSGSAQGAMLAGDYSIIVSGLSSDNYNIHYINGELHITTNSQMEQAQQQAAAAQRKNSDWVSPAPSVLVLNMDAGGGLRVASATESLLSLQPPVPVTTTLKELLPNLGTMVFPSESSNIDIEQVKKWLSALVDRLKASPDSKILVVGHTDNTGSERYNDYLSVERAEVIARILQGMGVSSAQIEIQGLGFKHPLASNNTTTGRARNRRVDLLLP